MAEVTLELIGEQLTRMFDRLERVDTRLAGLETRLDSLEDRMVTKGDVVALFRGLELPGPRR